MLNDTRDRNRLLKSLLTFVRSSSPYLHSPVENEDHCDFKKLRSLLIRTHMLDLISTTEETHYEAYRQAQMETRKFGEPKVKKLDNPKFKEEEEMLRKRFTEQVKLEEARFRQWEQHVSSVRLGLLITSREKDESVCRVDFPFL